jgi:glycosyltransferase involved in cell wall biosynthesis
MVKLTPKIVVLTPVKNEEWILERFLSVTSQFADRIIIADQNSTDNSVSICKKYPKVTLIRNHSDDFNEAERQLLLINTARDLVPEHKILLALDADEILAANATKTLGWQSMLQSPPGTIIFFEKQDLYPTSLQFIRYPQLFPLGYVDDGTTHTPSKIHSSRVPTPDSASRLYVHDMKLMHYTWLRPDAQNSKKRMYGVLENILRTSSWLNRRIVYSPYINHLSADKIESVPHEWFEDWEKVGIDMTTILDQKFYWQDFEVLKYFHKYGVKRFWVEPIWEYDWESCRLYALEKGVEDIPVNQISKPPQLLILLLKLMDALYLILKNCQIRFKPENSKGY